MRLRDIVIANLDKTNAEIVEIAAQPIRRPKPFVIDEVTVANVLGLPRADEILGAMELLAQQSSLVRRFLGFLQRNGIDPSNSQVEENVNALIQASVLTREEADAVLYTSVIPGLTVTEQEVETVRQQILHEQACDAKASKVDVAREAALALIDEARQNQTDIPSNNDLIAAFSASLNGE